jgi:uncharacterized protein with PQ loop repeat
MSQEWTEAVKLAVVSIALVVLIGFIMTLVQLSLRSQNKFADDVASFSTVTSFYELDGMIVDRITARTIARKYYDLVPVYITNTVNMVSSQNDPEAYIKSQINLNGRYEITVRSDRSDINFQTYIVIRRL